MNLCLIEIVFARGSDLPYFSVFWPLGLFDFCAMSTDYSTLLQFFLQKFVLYMDSMER